MVAQRRWIRIAGLVSFVAVAAAACDVQAGWHHRYRGYGSSGSSGGSSGGSYGSGGSSGGSYGSYGSSGGSSGGSYGTYGSYGSSGGSWGSHHAYKRAMRAARHGSSGGSYAASYGSSGGSSGGSYSASYGSAGGSSGGGSSGGYATSSSVEGYSSAMPIESYRVINETPSMTGGEIIGTPSAVPGMLDSTARETVPADGALLVVEVPADATVYVNGAKTTSQGAVRRYLSRGLAAGQKYEFVVRMATEAGKESTKVVSLTAGQRSNVSFSTAVEAPKTSVTLRVPADAKVWLAGNATASTGDVRTFETSSLPAGKTWKGYEIRVAAVVDGQERTVSKVIDLAAGDVVDLTLDPAVRTASAETTAALN
jgi:uncharacterized protein (TIGR03000 family)